MQIPALAVRSLTSALTDGLERGGGRAVPRPCPPLAVMEDDAPTTLVRTASSTTSPLEHGSHRRLPVFERPERAEVRASRRASATRCRCTVSTSKQKRIHLPRALCPVGAQDERVVGEAVEFPTDPPPRDYQKELFDETADSWPQGQSGIVVGLHRVRQDCDRLSRRRRGRAARRWSSRPRTTFTSSGSTGRERSPSSSGSPAAEVGEIRGDKCEVQGTKFCVAMIHSLSKDGKYPDWITKGFGLVIFDECHRVPAEQFQNVVPTCSRRCCGSASRPRPSGRTARSCWSQAHIGPLRAKTDAQLMVPKVLRFQIGLAVPALCPDQPGDRRERSRRASRMQPGKTTHIEKMIAADKMRNHMIARLIKQALDKGRKIVVFSTLHRPPEGDPPALHQERGDLGPPDRASTSGRPPRPSKE